MFRWLGILYLIVIFFAFATDTLADTHSTLGSNIFFVLSKTLWFLIVPGNCILILFVFSLLIRRRAPKIANTTLSLLGVFTVIIAIFPIGHMFVQILENRFQRPISLPADIEGIVILGGIIDPHLSHTRGITQIGGAIERITEGISLAKLYPNSKIIFSGGSGSIANQNFKEAHYARKVFDSLGFPSDRVIFENESRNTIENAKYSMKLAQPNIRENWFLITSAMHMPRAIGVFRQLDWPINPFPVDYNTHPRFTGAWYGPKNWSFNLTAGLSMLNRIVHEFAGLFVYRITGKTNAFFPGPLFGVEFK